MLQTVNLIVKPKKRPATFRSLKNKMSEELLENQEPVAEQAPAAEENQVEQAPVAEAQEKAAPVARIIDWLTAGDAELMRDKAPSIMTKSML